MARMNRSRPIGLWLLAVVAMIGAQILLGGITRLTGSGLSITEWRPVTGVVPPLTQDAWQEQFVAYQQLPQFRAVNAHFALDDFKRIYFWEWLHRLWGRLVGVVFVLPGVVFALRRKLDRRLALRLLLLAGLGAAQGALGWFMVLSGLKTLVYVSHVRLALHLVAALALLVALYWQALGQLSPADRSRAAPRPAKLAWGLVALLAVQIVYGAFMAGLKAAPAAPSWPSINGVFLPRASFENAQALIDDPLTVHFIHRGLAYLLVVLVLAFWVWLLRQPPMGVARWVRHGPPVAIGVQLALGISAVLEAGKPGLFVAIAAAHQLGAVAVLLALVTVAWFAGVADSDQAGRAARYTRTPWSRFRLSSTWDAAKAAPPSATSSGDATPATRSTSAPECTHS
jgi:heme a synthase